MNSEIVKVHETTIECPYHEGEYYVAVRSVCQALGIDYRKQFERIKSDPILGDAVTHTVTTSDASGNRKQPMFCLQLKYVYGWLFSIETGKVNARARETFINYKRECYETLYKHFSGKSTERQDVLKEKAALLREAETIRLELEGNPAFRRLQELEKRKSELTKNLTGMDKQVLQTQLDMFRPEN